MSYQFYKVLHVASLFLLFTSLAAIAFSAADKRKPWAALHGIATLVAFVAGFGLLAKIGAMKAFPSWALVKIVIWLALGAMPVILRKKPGMALQLLLASVLLGAVGSYTAVNKPGQQTPVEVQVAPSEMPTETPPATETPAN